MTPDICTDLNAGLGGAYTTLNSTVLNACSETACTQVGDRLLCEQRYKPCPAPPPQPRTFVCRKADGTEYRWTEELNR